MRLAGGKYTQVDENLLTNLKKHSWCLDRNGYVRRTYNSPTGSHAVYLHRVVIGAKKGEAVDHINRNKRDNRLVNLRLVTRFENMMNLGTRKKSVSGMRGITWSKTAKKWRVRIRKHNTLIHFGYFKTKKSALLAWNMAYENLNR